MDNKFNYYCMSCKQSFESDILNNVRCSKCHDGIYVRRNKIKVKTIKTKDDIISKQQSRIKLLENKIYILETRIRLKKFFLVYEHFITAAMKKYIPDKESFNECLMLAKKETINKKKQLYNDLIKSKVLKESFGEMKH